MNNKPNQLIIKRIKNLCEKEKHVTPYRIAKNVGMNPSTLNNILDGRFNDPRFSTIEKVCNGLNISLKEFFDDDIFN
jgi:transcriptional regulator with XRE-family HTH domain